VGSAGLELPKIAIITMETDTSVTKNQINARSAIFMALVLKQMSDKRCEHPKREA
jgi:hypothetical protein